MTLLPAYGRDYKNAKEARNAWKDGKDFIIAQTGQYCSIRDGIRDAFIRYDNKRKIVKA
jgi:hypothetical protein